jgi:hypothetical protein
MKEEEPRSAYGFDGANLTADSLAFVLRDCLSRHDKGDRFEIVIAAQIALQWAVAQMPDRDRPSIEMDANGSVSLGPPELPRLVGLFNHAIERWITGRMRVETPETRDEKKKTTVYPWNNSRRTVCFAEDCLGVLHREGAPRRFNEQVKTTDGLSITRGALILMQMNERIDVGKDGPVAASRTVAAMHEMKPGTVLKFYSRQAYWREFFRESEAKRRPEKSTNPPAVRTSKTSPSA